MQNIPHHTVQINTEEDELIACWRLLDPAVQDAITMIIAANIYLPQSTYRRDRRKKPRLAIVRR